MKLSDERLRAILGGESHHLPEGGESWSDMWQSLAEDMARELLAARKVVEEVRVRTDDMGFFNGSAHNLRTLLHAYDEATEGE